MIATEGRGKTSLGCQEYVSRDPEGMARRKFRETSMAAEDVSFEKGEPNRDRCDGIVIKCWTSSEIYQLSQRLLRPGAR